jgi:hypothetical protein
MSSQNSELITFIYPSNVNMPQPFPFGHTMLHVIDYSSKGFLLMQFMFSTSSLALQNISFQICNRLRMPEI